MPLNSSPSVYPTTSFNVWVNGKVTSDEEVLCCKQLYIQLETPLSVLLTRLSIHMNTNPCLHASYSIMYAITSSSIETTSSKLCNSEYVVCARTMCAFLNKSCHEIKIYNAAHKSVTYKLHTHANSGESKHEDERG